jgi:hypothetical protein
VSRYLHGSYVIQLAVSVGFLIAYVLEQTLSYSPGAVPRGIAVPLWAYVSRRLRYAHLASFLLLNISDQSLFSNAYHMHFLSMLVLLCLFPPYTSSSCDSLSGNVFCPIISRITARDNRHRRMERLRSSRSLISGSCLTV